LAEPLMLPNEATDPLAPFGAELVVQRGIRLPDGTEWLVPWGVFGIQTSRADRRKKVTDLSGRGVGMDLVKTMIHSLNGMIDIKSEPGEGTTFLIKIPLTLAIIQVLLAQIGGYTYAFPVETVLEIIRVKSSEIYFIDGNPIVKLREHALSLVSLEQIIKIAGTDRTQQDSHNVVIVSDGINRVGVVVDELLAKEEIVIKSLPSYFSKVQGISGASILADGRVALILDIHAIIRSTL
ncbi:MAG TPA: DUF5047 domain-containing protein, partial [Candidatus Omnitrophota bacterium]|nr:DUF5047 domain-containing protein [Candidatus Omnitrophota bacterium]